MTCSLSWCRSVPSARTPAPQKRPRSCVWRHGGTRENGDNVFPWSLGISYSGKNRKHSQSRCHINPYRFWNLVSISDWSLSASFAGGTVGSVLVSVRYFGRDRRKWTFLKWRYPKSSIVIGCFAVNHQFWGAPILGTPQTSQV